ncbi:hypothetical protein KEU06_07760 [Pseudaminobacter sp. 19-2017]|uniref:Uncharacterized protein n=1 Tax=Pseudaminobacter soli (ex Zhang et al. 2022) TaxID=2831468 RepID=A0A942E4V2_9HYPH|nr:hypothetical protein [Pseudaminobacter soli]MBS3648522.1 hypothetical protein [Pseudaminobacter soli]
MREAAERGGFGGSYAVRHDVDYHLGRALLMGLVEQDCGVRSTFYLLPPGHGGIPANYYGRLRGKGIEHAPTMIEAAHRLVAMGHEIGLHNDFIALSRITGVPAQELITAEIAWFAAEGIAISGSAAHGSKFSRGLGYVNYEVFKECDRRLATVFVDREVPAMYGREIADGSFQFTLNSVPMADVGLSYEAYFIGPCFYLMDSGGQMTIRWFEEGRPMVETIDVLDAERLADAYGRSGSPGIQALIHADHWLFGRTDAVEALRRAAPREPKPPPHAHILPVAYLERSFDVLKHLPNTRLVTWRTYEPECERKASGATHEHGVLDRQREAPTEILVQLYAGPEPQAVERVLAVCRRLKIPYTLFAFARWHHPSWGLIEPYPLDWTAIRADVEAGLGCVGYLYNAMHLVGGDRAAAAEGLASDIKRLNDLGLRCQVMAPFPAQRSPSMPPLDEDVRKAFESSGLARLLDGTGESDTLYDDALLPNQRRAGADLNLATWTKANAKPGARLSVSIHPHYYGPNLRLPDQKDPRWIRAARAASNKGMA